MSTSQGQNETREAYLERRKLNHERNADKERAYRKQAAEKICNTTKEWQKTVNGVFCVSHSHQVKNSKKRGHPAPNYTIDDLKERFLNDEFLRIHSEWVESGYQTDKKPSFDRIDSEKPYTLDNVQLFTHEMNNAKGYKENKKKVATPVEIYDLQGNLLKKVDCLADASEFSGVCRSDISLCLNGKVAQRKGFSFKRPDGVGARKRGGRENLSDLIDKSIAEVGYFSSKIAYNSGIVTNMTDGGVFPVFEGFDSVSLCYNAFTDATSKLAKDKGLSSTVLVTKGDRSKIYFKNIEDMSKGIRALSVLDKALDEFLRLQPVG